MEIDETYIGGKPRNQNALRLPNGILIPRKYPKKNKRGRGTKKTPVVGILDRKTGRVYLQVALPNEEGKKLSGKQLLAIIEKACKEATIFTLGMIYGKVHQFAVFFIQDIIRLEIISNNLCPFLDKNIHTNGIEGFWSIVKRAWVGTYHHYLKKYMQKYLDECGFRYQHRKNAKIFDVVLEQAVGV